MGPGGNVARLVDGVSVVSPESLQFDAYPGLGVVKVPLSSGFRSGWVCDRLLKPGRFVVDVLQDLAKCRFGDDGRKRLARLT